MKDALNAYEDMIDVQLKEWSSQIALLTLKYKTNRTRAEVKKDDDKFMRRLV